MHWKTHELSRSGVMGAPDLASPEKGRWLFEACVDGVAALIGELRALPI
jgi:creatinine amidohydrolase/Fe(II)-dependent formamide hydrolase-like protein